MWSTLALLAFLIKLALGEHSGAYSSPQYAKKMYPKQGFEHNELLPNEKPPVTFKHFDNEAKESSDVAEHRRGSFMESAGSFLSGAGGQVMSSLAKDFIARSTGTSQVGFDCVTQVLSLNLTNLVILVLLKALILAAGFFGAGAWKGGHYYGRSLDDNKNAPLISEDEIMLYLSYLAGHQSQEYGCLYRLACQKPRQAALYSSGAQLLLQSTKLFRGNSLEMEQYEDVAEGLKNATSWGEEGMPCEERYQCGE